jgi:hypothetical protein
VTCPECIAVAREDLMTIVQLCGFPLLEEVLTGGVDSEAAMLLGPAANTEAWQYRAKSAMLGRINAEYLDDCRDEAHPLWTLGWIETEWREAFDHEDSADRTTIPDAAAYVGRMLHIVAGMVEMPDGSQAPEFDDAKRRLAACRGSLESAVRAGERDEKGAPCPTCRTKEPDRTAPALVLSHDDKDTSGASDRWRCPRCKSWWSEADYRLRVGSDHIEHADELTVTDMVARTRVPAGTIRKWASRTTRRIDGETVEIPPRLKPCGRSHDGRRLYRVADVIALRDSDSQRVA